MKLSVREVRQARPSREPGANLLRLDPHRLCIDTDRLHREPQVVEENALCGTEFDRRETFRALKMIPGSFRRGVFKMERGRMKFRDELL